MKGSGETILVAEDDQPIRDLLRNFLIKIGYDPITAVDGESAVKAGESIGKIDLLIADINMPGMDGPQLAEELGMLHPKMKIMFMSGFPETEFQDLKSRWPKASFIQKPIALSVLSEKLDLIFKG